MHHVEPLYLVKIELRSSLIYEFKSVGRVVSLKGGYSIASCPRSDAVRQKASRNGNKQTPHTKSTTSMLPFSSIQFRLLFDGIRICDEGEEPLVLLKLLTITTLARRVCHRGNSAEHSQVD